MLITKYLRFSYLQIVVDKELTLTLCSTLQSVMSHQAFKENLVAKKSKANQKTTDNKRKKICQICGDFSLGFNFGAVSCESCKAFFRRNAVKMKVIIVCTYM